LTLRLKVVAAAPVAVFAQDTTKTILFTSLLQLLEGPGAGVVIRLSLRVRDFQEKKIEFICKFL